MVSGAIVCFGGYSTRTILGGSALRSLITGITFFVQAVYRSRQKMKTKQNFTRIIFQISYDN